MNAHGQDARAASKRVSLSMKIRPESREVESAKNAECSHDLIENKGSQSDMEPLSHDVVENKQHIS